MRVVGYVVCAGRFGGCEDEDEVEARVAATLAIRSRRLARSVAHCSSRRTSFGPVMFICVGLCHVSW